MRSTSKKGRLPAGPQRRESRTEGLWNILAAMLLISTLLILAYYSLIALQPSSSLNPFPPPTPVVLAYIPTAVRITPTPRPVASPTIVGDITPSQVTATALPPATQTSTAIRPVATIGSTLTPSPTQTPTLTPSPTRSPFTFTASLNYQVHPVLTCDWTGAAGTAFDLKGKAARDYIVQATGANGITQQIAVGTSPDYGSGGWELRLGGRQAKGTWQLQLYAASDLKNPVSDTFEIVFEGLCQKNLVFVRFQQNH